MKIKSKFQNVVKWVLPFYLFTFLPFNAKAEDGHQLWLRYQALNQAKVTGVECLAAEELRTYSTQDVVLKLDPAMEQDAYSLKVKEEEGKKVNEITAKDEIGLLYGA